MVESIYTIPLTDALDQDCDCMFCYLEDKLEGEQIEYALGAAMMEPDFRILSNEKGYCRHHIGMMARAKSALPLALILDTRCDEVINQLKAVDFSAKGGLFKKEKSPAEKLSEVVTKLDSTCLVCERIEHTMEKFANTFWYLYGKEPEFKKRFLESRGVCIHHFAKLMNALLNVSGSKRDEFVRELYDLQMKVLENEKCEVQGFTKQFDYRSDKGEWKVARDAHLNCAARLSGSFERE
ncbi:MAG: hypothetical protein IJC10_05505 [Clostridia bacterium]|nr:hypothetical protein [Clostridia bacterium]